MVETTNSDVDYLISTKLAFLSGGKTSSGSFIISVTDSEEPTNENFSKILKFLFDTIVDLDRSARFVLVVDRRKSKWPNIKPFLNFVQETFPDSTRIERIFLLQPTGMFSSLFKLVSVNFGDAKVEFLSSISDLHKKLDKSQLTLEFDGLLDFVASDWLNDKQAVDEISAYITKMKLTLEELISRTHDTMTSSDEVALMSLSEVDEMRKAEVETFQRLLNKLACCQSNVKAHIASMTSSLPMKYIHIKRLERLQPFLDSLKSNCQNHCNKFETFMDKVSRLKRLSEQVEQVLMKAQSHLEGIRSVKVIGCTSLDEVQVSMNSLRNFEYLLKSLKQENGTVLSEVEKFTEMSPSASSDAPLVNGEEFSTSATTIESSVDGEVVISSEREVVRRLTSKISEQTTGSVAVIADIEGSLQFAFQQLHKTQDAISAMDKAVDWRRKGEELLCRHSHLPLNASVSTECQEIANQLKSFKDTLGALDFLDISSFQSTFSEVLDDSLLEMVKKMYAELSAVQEKINELVDKLIQKELDLKEVERLEALQLQRAQSLEVAALKDGEDSKSVDSMEYPQTEEVETSTAKKESHSMPFLKSRRFPQAKIVVDSRIIPGMLSDKNICQRLDIINASRDHCPPPCASDGSLDSTNRRFQLLDIRQSTSLDDMEKYIPPRLREDLIGIQPVPDSGTIRRKRSHVIQELIETERAYTSDLKNIIEGYYDQFDNSELQDLIPRELADKKDVLFGNIKDIYAFHSQIFLKSLEACESRACDVGKCFIENKERLHLYSIYCQNKIQAEHLIEKVGDNNPFFRECQKRLNHPLPFSSYILKPVQRITKYHLLLKELVRMTTNQSETSDLKRAIMAICDVLRYVNNSMHQLSITGFPGNLVEQGKLLIQGTLEVSVEKRKDRGSSIKQTFHKRQVFLYDKCILFCKRKDSSANLVSYVFKSLLKTDEVGPLVESPKGGDDRRFELWSKNEVWSFMTSSPDEKLDWVEEIKKVLYEQMDHLRATHKRLREEFTSQTSRDIRLFSNEPDSLISSDLENCSDP